MTIPIKRSIRINYYLYAFAIGSSNPFLAPYFQEKLHVSDYELGILLMIRPAMAILAQPLWSYIADTTGKRSHLAAAVALAASLLFPLMITVDPLPFVALMFAVWAFFNAPINTLMDSITFDYLGHHKRMRFAHFRVFASFGFITAVMFIGRFYDLHGLSWLFGCYAVSVVVTAYFLWKIPANGRMPLKSGWHALRQLLRKRNVVFFLLAVLIAETANYMGYNFLSVYSKSLGANNIQVGWTWAIATMSEVVTMYYFSQTAGRIGIKKILFIGMVSGIVRWTLFAFVHNWWQLLPLQMLHAFTLTFIYVGAAIFIDLESPAEIRFTAQAFYSTFILNGGAILGSYFAGGISSIWGYAYLFLAAGILAAVACIIFIFFVREPVQHQATPAETAAVVE